MDTQWITDAHFHPSMTDFDEADQKKRTEDDIAERIAKSLERLLSQGVVCIRDAGILTPRLLKKVREKTTRIPKIIPCAAMLRSDEDVRLFLKGTDLPEETEGPVWVKIMATGGVGSDPESVLVPRIREELFRKAVRCAHARGMGVMVHCYGGESLDWCAEEGVETIEHGIFMRRDQAKALADAGTAFVVTGAIYDMIAEGEAPLLLPEFLRERAKRYAEAQAASVRYAREEGVRLGFGTDFFSDPALAGKELSEIRALEKRGLGSEDIRKIMEDTAAICRNTPALRRAADKPVNARVREK